MNRPGKCGIYAIINRVTGDCYVGKATNTADRWSNHLAKLRKGKHHSPYLQASFDKYGEKAHAINVLEECEPAELDQKEHDWMLRVRATLNVMTPDFLRHAAGRGIDGRLRRRPKDQGQKHSRYICSCGQLKALGSRGCLGCLKRIAAEMKASGFLPDDHRFEWEPEPTDEGSSPKTIPDDEDLIRSRTDMIGCRAFVGKPAPLRYRQERWIAEPDLLAH